MLPADVHADWLDAFAMSMGWLVFVALAAVVGVCTARIIRGLRKWVADCAKWRQRRIDGPVPPESAEVTRHVYAPRHRRALPPPSPSAARVRIITAAGRRVVAAVRRDGGVRA